MVRFIFEKILIGATRILKKMYGGIFKNSKFNTYNFVNRKFFCLQSFYFFRKNKKNRCFNKN